MVTPVYNEHAIAMYLNPAISQTPDTLRALTRAVAINAWDRKVTRQNFIKVLDEVLETRDILLGMEVAVNTSHVLHEIDPEKPPKILADSVEKLQKRLQILRENLREQITLMSECPRDGDKIS